MVCAEEGMNPKRLFGIDNSLGIYILPAPSIVRPAAGLSI